MNTGAAQAPMRRRGVHAHSSRPCDATAPLCGCAYALAIVSRISWGRPRGTDSWPRKGRLPRGGISVGLGFGQQLVDAGMDVGSLGLNDQGSAMVSNTGGGAGGRAGGGIGARLGRRGLVGNGHGDGGWEEQGEDGAAAGRRAASDPGAGGGSCACRPAPFHPSFLHHFSCCSSSPLVHLSSLASTCQGFLLSRPTSMIACCPTVGCCFNLTVCRCADLRAQEAGEQNVSFQEVIVDCEGLPIEQLAEGM